MSIFIQEITRLRYELLIVLGILEICNLSVVDDKKINGDCMGGACNTHEHVKNMYKILVKNPEWKRPTHRWENNIKMDLKEIRKV